MTQTNQKVYLGLVVLIAIILLVFGFSKFTKKGGSDLADQNSISSFSTSSDDLTTPTEQATSSSNSNNQNTNVPKNGSQITVSGTTTCLPHRIKGEAETLECAVGLKAKDGKYYGLVDGTQHYVFDVDVDITVSGLFVATTTSNYAVIGNITVGKISLNQ